MSTSNSSLDLGLVICIIALFLTVNAAKVDAKKRNKIGSVVEIGGLKSYVSGHSHSKYAVVLASDVFGYETPNLRKIADKVGAAGYYAVVPDFFNGDPYNASITTLAEWRSRHPSARAAEASITLIEALKSRGFSAIAAAGFCYGAHASMELSKTDLIQAVVFLHPTDIVADDFKSISLQMLRVPVEILGGELDRGVSPAVIRTYMDILSSRPEIPSFAKIFPGVGHGWTTRYNETTQKSAEEAHQDLINWVNKYIKHKKTVAGKIWI